MCCNSSWTSPEDALAGADAVSTTLVRDDKGWTAAYQGRLALDADELQYERGYGPCMDAGRTGTVMLVDDMREETRWPDYTAQVAARGVLSSLSVPLPIQTDVIGALNCYSRTPSAFSAEAIEIAEELAGHVAVAVGNAVAYADATSSWSRCGRPWRAGPSSTRRWASSWRRTGARRSGICAPDEGLAEPQHQAARDRPRHRRQRQPAHRALSTTSGWP